MKRIKYISLLIVLITIVICSGGCKNDTMDNIDIIVSNYPNEYVVKKLYGDHATISSIYPDGVDISSYKITNKRKSDFAHRDLFVYNGFLEKERDLAVELLELNSDLRIIDTAYVLETEYSPEELWLNPSSLLMMSQNVRIALNEYITNNYLSKEVDDAYEKLRVELSELDAEYRLAVESTDNKTVIVADSALKYLEKFGLRVICIDTDANQITLTDAENSIINQEVSYIISFKGLEDNENVKSLLERYSTVNKLELHKLDNISDDERSNGANYDSIMRDNLELIKKELYQ